VTELNSEFEVEGYDASDHDDDKWGSTSFSGLNVYAPISDPEMQMLVGWVARAALPEAMASDVEVAASGFELTSTLMIASIQRVVEQLGRVKFNIAGEHGDWESPGLAHSYALKLRDLARAERLTMFVPEEETAPNG
jgi:hypothetical protein